ncbi:GNAT family N-acetyltransferase [Leadbettera azotonutricia]|uniref:Acetyltransferase, GNAT family n=1 Tax=Leadbettera azotonutricia (strain ATCC BAA-888 / DSM 13862 / ZAS-9) TaxID=545695 RepID=F5YA04_LEAAZ|nr:GNAT family N-acetyltransferase [Leadbettera azotonutricia]AEF80895.1 acetyltransferase, GNAT family [Leadbettera azotonutricia ZAS-9]
MQFELTEALMDDILFSMEDQDGDFHIDTKEGVVAEGDDDPPEEGDDEEGRYISLPEWDSSSGFRLMERFAAGFRNPLIRDELTSALNRGRGVFRAFKNTLSQHPEAEKMWFLYKEREMKQEIISWYNALREEWGLEKIGLEPEDTGDLVLEDFRFREFRESDLQAAKELHKLCIDAAKEAGISPEDAAKFPGEMSFMSESGGGEFAGFISAGCKHSELRIGILEVRPEYRGLGIGEALLTRLLAALKAGEASRVFVDLPAGFEGFSRVLARSGFEPSLIRYSLNLEK